MKAYVSDTEDLKQDPSYQESWDDMIINVSTSNFIHMFETLKFVSSIFMIKLLFKTR